MTRPPELETDAAGLRERQALWDVLSELWLDNEPQPRDVERIAGVIARSRYTLAQARAIHDFEVAPAVWLNLTLVAGEWAYFDPAWLHARCAAFARRRDARAHRVGVWLRGPWVRFHTGALWARIEARVGALASL